VNDAIYLNLGEPGYPPPQRAVRAAAEASRAGRGGYAPPGGWGDLPEALADHVRRRHGIAARADEVTVTAGGSGGLFAALAALTRPGDQVLVPDPGYPGYRRLTETLHVEASPYRLDGAAGYTPDFTRLGRAAGRRTRVILWNAPANPTGVVARAGVVGELLALAERHGLWVLSDEVYDELVFEGEHTSPAAVGDRARVVSVFSFSKTYALTGWRVGWVLGPAALVGAVRQIHWAAVMSPCTVGQIAARECLREPAPYRARLLAWLRENRDRALAALGELGVPCVTPAAGLFVWADLSGLTADVEAWAEELWRRQRVALMPGTPFGAEGKGHARILFAVEPELLAEGLRRIRTFCRGRPGRRKHAGTGARRP
jgi:aspartate/methionine/tyrosine aminotransferase